MVYWLRGQMVARLPSGGRQNGPQRKGGGQAEREGKQVACAGPMHSWAPTTETGGVVGEGKPGSLPGTLRQAQTWSCRQPSTCSRKVSCALP